MKTNQWVDELKTLIPSHFKVIEESNSTQIKQLIPQQVSGDVILLRRVNSRALGYRTILVACVDSIHIVSDALYWAANVRDSLPEPCTADLYLFLEIKNISIDECNRIEADDQYCRKFIKKPDETTVDFIQRTFLVLPLRQKNKFEVKDPISVALQQTAKQYPAFVLEEQEYWYQELLSNKKGEELAEKLLGYAQIQGDIE